MIDRGNVNHNRRHFITKNVDASRTIYNHEYVYIDIRDAYNFCSMKHCKDIIVSNIEKTV